jgi:hypothetical protein
VTRAPTDRKARSANNLVITVCVGRMVFMSISDAPKGQIRWLSVEPKSKYLVD